VTEQIQEVKTYVKRPNFIKAVYELVNKRLKKTILGKWH